MGKPRTFREAVEQFETAVREDAWKGAKHPGDREGIAIKYQQAKDNLMEYFALAQERTFRRGEDDARSRASVSPGHGDMGG